MRVTNKMLSNDFLSDMRTNLENLRTIQQQMTSGKEIRKPSDDPFRAARVVQLQTDINSNTQYKSNIQDASDFLDTTDTALNQAGNVLQRVRELLLSAGNAAYSSQERKAVKDEINQRVGELAQILNTNFDGKYIFGGTRATSKPVDVVNPVVCSFSSVTSPAGAAVGTVSGAFTGTTNTNYQVKTILDTSTAPNKFKGYQVSTDGGSTWQPEVDFTTPKDINTPADVAIGQGITLHLDTSTNQIMNNGVYSFTANVALPNENSRLIYIARDGSELTGTLEAAVNVSNISSWNTKVIGFNIGGSVQNITISGTINTLDDLKNAVNSAISANAAVNGKVKADVYTNSTGSYIKLTKLTSDNITIVDPSTEAPPAGVLPPDLAPVVGKEIPDSQIDMIKSGLNLEISQGVIMQYNVSAGDIIEFNNEQGVSKDLRSILSKMVNHLDGNSDDGTQADSTAVSKLSGSDLQDITDAMNNLIKVRSEVGAKGNRMDSAKSKNDDETTNMTEVLSKTDDIDITQKTMEYANMQTVYMASLQTSAKVLQPTLMDYLN